MKAFIGAKIIQAEPMDLIAFKIKFKKPSEAGTKNEPGYHVVYPDDYHSWSPKEVFEVAYREVLDGEAQMISG